MQEKIKFLKTLLECEQFVVTGSQALVLMGLAESAADLDIILINPTPATKDVLVRLAEQYPAPTKFEYVDKGIIFMHEGVKIDVFFLDKKIETSIQTNYGVDLNPINKIVLAKKTYNRTKDWLQLRNLSRKILSNEEFNSFLNSAKI